MHLIPVTHARILLGLLNSTSIESCPPTYTAVGKYACSAEALALSFLLGVSESFVSGELGLFAPLGSWTDPSARSCSFSSSLYSSSNARVELYGSMTSQAITDSSSKKEETKNGGANWRLLAISDFQTVSGGSLPESG